MVIRYKIKKMIRPATPADAFAVAPLMIKALGHIAGIFANSENYEDAIPFMEMFFKRDDNQYSYVNTIVYENENGVVGSVTGYDGKCLHALRQPVLDELHKHNPGFMPNDETEAGEYYLDCVNVKEDQQGKGIGKILINAFCDRGFSLGHNRIGLIVDLDNPEAMKLYTRLGFYEAGKRDFMGHQYFHMVREYYKKVEKQSSEQV